jgi:hypothetical protein
MSFPNELVCKRYKEEKTIVSENIGYFLNDIESVLKAVSKESKLPLNWLINTDTYKTADSEILEPLTAYYMICDKLWPREDYKIHKVSIASISELVGRTHATVLHHLKKDLFYWPNTKELIKNVLAKKI